MSIGSRQDGILGCCTGKAVQDGERIHRRTGVLDARGDETRLTRTLTEPGFPCYEDQYENARLVPLLARIVAWTLKRWGAHLREIPLHGPGHRWSAGLPRPVEWALDGHRLAQVKQSKPIMKPEYVLPERSLDAFNCPNCHVYSRQFWYHLKASSGKDGFGTQFEDYRFMVSNCDRCDFPTIWLREQMLFPVTGGADPPNPDLPMDIKDDYEEARSIIAQSPRGAAALLRLAIQKLCMHFGQPGKNVNDDIKALVASGLPNKVQEALDSVRVIGNEAVHPGTLNLRDDRKTANMLFRLVNFIATKLISEPAEIDGMYAAIPEQKRRAIEDRDAK